MVFFSAKVRPDDQDTQQRCEQSDKQVDASELLPRNRANRCFRSLSARRTWDVRPSLRAQRRTSGPSAPSSRTSPRVQICCSHRSELRVTNAWPGCNFNNFWTKQQQVSNMLRTRIGNLPAPTRCVVIPTSCAKTNPISIRPPEVVHLEVACTRKQEE